MLVDFSQAKDVKRMFELDTWIDRFMMTAIEPPIHTDYNTLILSIAHNKLPIGTRGRGGRRCDDKKCRSGSKHILPTRVPGPCPESDLSRKVSRWSMDPCKCTTKQLSSMAGAVSHSQFSSDRVKRA